MEKIKDKVGVAAMPPSRFPDGEKYCNRTAPILSFYEHGNEDIFAWLKFLKAAHRRTSIESVLDYLYMLKQQGKSTAAVRPFLRWFFKTASLQKGEESADDSAAPAREYVIDVEREDKGGPPWEQLLVTVIRIKASSVAHRGNISGLRRILLPHGLESSPLKKRRRKISVSVSGKGGKDRVSVLPESLRTPLAGPPRAAAATF